MNIDNINEISINYSPISSFLVENVDIQDLNGGFIKKFTSLAIMSTIFRWKFGDEKDPSKYLETIQNPVYHTFKEAGTYQISHQSCYPCGGQLVCSNGWCTKSIYIIPPGKDLSGLAAASIFGFLIFKGISCEDRETKKECEELKDYCMWVKKEKKCVNKCKEGYKLEKVRTDDIKKPFRLKCIPSKLRLKSEEKK